MMIDCSQPLFSQPEVYAICADKTPVLIFEGTFSIAYDKAKKFVSLNRRVQILKLDIKTLTFKEELLISEPPHEEQALFNQNFIVENYNEQRKYKR